MDNFDFNKILYVKPSLTVSQRKIHNVIGIDTETTVRGKCFMLCTSLGDVFTIDDVPRCFFSRKYRNANFVVWNLRFDSGSILQCLPRRKLVELWKTTRTSHNGFDFLYIPHKMLRISRGKNAVTFWDIKDFYGMSLDDAAKQFLSDKKIEIETKKFTVKYIQKNFDKIKEYCIHDAVLTKKLADKLFVYIKKFKIEPSNLYSIASVGFELFKRKSKMIDVYRFWRNNRDLLYYACQAYRGGKFEITARGTFDGYEYDINSAYPYEISRLVDISKAQVVRSKKYEKDAMYGFLKVRIFNKEAVPSPVGIKHKTFTFYPCGVFSAYITKSEYEYFVSKNVQVDILDGYFLYIDRIEYPYKSVIDFLYEMKEKYRHTDRMIYKLAKLFMNSFYGKMVQLTKSHRGFYIAGPGWNPIYGAVITANVRCFVSDIQHRLGKNCLAVHTDSVLTTVELPHDLVGKQLGKFSLEKKGRGLIVYSGIYEIEDKNAMRCFHVDGNFSWRKYLQEFGKSEKILLREHRVKTWIEAVAEKNFTDINVFKDIPKWLYLNREQKRIWLEKTNCEKLLTTLEYSIPHFIYE